jgi:hypothetical protein
MFDLKLLHLVATVLGACDHRPSRGPGRPPTETIRVVATLRRFLREGTPPGSRPCGSRPADRMIGAAYEGIGFVTQSLRRAACMFLVAGRLVREFWQPALRR